MDESDLVSKSDIARLLHVRRSTVTMWQRRYRDFPAPVRTGDVELFPLGKLASWLADRAVPADVRRADEPAGTTSADRLLRSRGIRDSAATGPEQAERLVATLASLGRGLAPRSGYLDLVATLLYVRCRYPDQWSNLLAAAHRIVHAVPDGTSFRVAWRRTVAALATEHGGPGPPPVDESVLSEGEQEIAVAVRLLDEFPLAADRAGSALTTAVFSSLVDQIVDAEGRRAVDHVTSASVAALVVGLAGQVSSGSRIHDPYCRTGELLASVVARAAETYPASDLVVTGSHESVRMLRLARMRLALLGVPGVSSSGSLHQLGGAAVDRGSVDVVVTNPPFSSRAPWPETEPDWPFGPPPRTNANFAWIQHAVSLLREGGRAVVVMANNASFSASPRERRIRENMIESGAVSCLVALPPGLFRGTGVLTTLWVLRPPTGRGDSILFLDARKFGAMVSPAHRILTNRDIDTIVSTFLDWRRASDEGRQQTAVAGLSTVATVDEIRDRDYALSPPMYVETPTGSNAGGPSIDDVPAFAVELSGLRLRAAEIDRKVEQLVWRLGPWRL